MSVKVSAIASHISMWAFDEVVDKVVERLMPLYLTAATDRTFINLDMEEYRDLDLTIAVFTRILEDPRLRDLEAGIVLQAYLPDALPALQQLTAWAQQHIAAGGARIKVRLVKGANLAMERVDAAMHGWPLATYGAKVDSDASYVRCLDFALRPENTAAVRIGVAGHNLFDVAYAWLLAGETGVRDDVEFEMLLGMAQGQVAAIAREVGHVLLYVPVVRPDEFDVAISYLVRRLEENASSDNFLSAAFDLADDPAMFERERDRFLASLERAADPSLPVGPNRTQDRRTAPPEVAAHADARASRRRTGRGRRADAGGHRHRTIGGHRPRRHLADRPRGRGGAALRRRALRRDGGLRAARVRRACLRCSGFPQRTRHRPGASREPGLGARDPRPHRDLDRGRRGHRGSACGRLADTRGRSSAG